MWTGPGSLTVVTAATLEPVTLDEAKRQARVDSDITADDGLIAGLIRTATLHVEKSTGRQLIQTRLLWQLDGILYAGCRGEFLQVPRPPLVAVQSVQYIDNNGTLQTWSSSLWQADLKSAPGRLRPAYGESWPSVRADFGTFRVTYDAGYGTAASSVPDPLRHAILLLVAHLYRFREPQITGTIVADIGKTIDDLIAPYIVHGF